MSRPLTPLRSAARREVIKRIAPCSREASFAQKGWLLDAVVAATGSARTGNGLVARERAVGHLERSIPDKRTAGIATAGIVADIVGACLGQVVGKGGAIDRRRIDERLRLVLWRRPERLRGLPLWIGVALEQGGVRPLLPPTRAPRAAQEAADRVLADFSFGLSQSRTVATGPRITWEELAEPPPGAEDLLLDLPPPAEPRLEPTRGHPAGPPLKLGPWMPRAASPVALPGILVVAVALRFGTLGARGFWGDELSTVFLVRDHGRV